jgi:hypothetical protein
MAYVNNLLESHIDGYKLCHSTRRPSPRMVENIGKWTSFITILSTISVASNLGVICFTSPSIFDGYSMSTKLFVFGVAEHFLFAIKGLIVERVGGTPKFVDLLHKRQTYMINKLMDANATTTKEAEHDENLEEQAEPLELDIYSNSALFHRLVLHKLKTKQKVPPHTKKQKQQFEHHAKDSVHDLQAYIDKGADAEVAGGSPKSLARARGGGTPGAAGGGGGGGGGGGSDGDDEGGCAGGGGGGGGSGGGAGGNGGRHGAPFAQAAGAGQDYDDDDTSVDTDDDHAERTGAGNAGGDSLNRAEDPAAARKRKARMQAAARAQMLAGQLTTAPPPKSSKIQI